MCGLTHCSPIHSPPPTAPHTLHQTTTLGGTERVVDGAVVAALRGKLGDPASTLPQKYRVLFSLRNIAGEEAHAAMLTGEGGGEEREGAAIFNACAPCAAPAASCAPHGSGRGWGEREGRRMRQLR